MLNFRATAFLTRSIRQDSRLLSHHGMRAGLALIILFFFFVQAEMSGVRSAVGAGFASSVANCCYWFLTILGGVHFSSTISEEKDEQTLALLKMTGASPFSILAGKALPRLAVAVLFLFVVAPFFLLSITLGGVLRLGILSCVCSMMTYAFMLGQLGLFASVVASSTRRAFSLMCLLWLFFEFPAFWNWMVQTAIEYLFGRDAGAGLSEFNVLVGSFSFSTNMSNTLLAFDPTEIWHTHMTYELIVGAVFFVVSWLVFEPCTNRAISEVRSSDLATRSLGASIGSSRPENDPVAWKSWRFLSGGWPWFFARLVVAPAVIFGVSASFLTITGWLEFPVVTMFSFYLGLGFWLVNIARMLGRCFSEEIRGETLASLVMLPRRTGKTFWSLVKGVIPAIVASASTLALSFAMLVLWAVSDSELDELLEVMVQPWIWHFVTWVAVTAHLGVLLTTYIRFGGMILSVAICWIGMPMVCGMSIGLVLSSGPGGGRELIQYVIPMMLIILEVFICAVIQRQIHDRLVNLAAK